MQSYYQETQVLSLDYPLKIEKFLDKYIGNIALTKSSGSPVSKSENRWKM